IAEPRERDRDAEIGADGEPLEARRRRRRRAGDDGELRRLVDDPVRVRVLPLEDVLRRRLSLVEAASGEAGEAALDLDPVADLGGAADAEHEILALVRIAPGERTLADRVAVHHAERVAEEMEPADDAQPEIERLRDERVLR